MLRAITIRLVVACTVLMPTPASCSATCPDGAGDIPLTMDEFVTRKRNGESFANITCIPDEAFKNLGLPEPDMCIDRDCNKGIELKGLSSLVYIGKQSLKDFFGGCLNNDRYPIYFECTSSKLKYIGDAPAAIGVGSITFTDFSSLVLIDANAFAVGNAPNTCGHPTITLPAGKSLRDVELEELRRTHTKLHAHIHPHIARYLHLLCRRSMLFA